QLVTDGRKQFSVQQATRVQCAKLRLALGQRRLQLADAPFEYTWRAARRPAVTRAPITSHRCSPIHSLLTHAGGQANAWRVTSRPFNDCLPTSQPSHSGASHVTARSQIVATSGTWHIMSRGSAEQQYAGRSDRAQTWCMWNVA